MNISTGGPHILLFERDQQMAALLISELQLAGYECHTARTAVEVFDAIARYAIRLVLVNLAQAATARREFWVALDTQRRDRRVQVFTFRCSNLAGYGPHDPDDNSHSTQADMEIEGMLGLMSLVDAVRSRVPNATIETTTNTMPRFPRQSPNATNPSMPQVVAPQLATQSNMNSNTFRPADSSPGQSTPLRHTTTVPQTPIQQPVAPMQQATPSFPNQQQAASGGSGTNYPGYTEKIRAVLYPNQRTWSSQSNTALPIAQEYRPGQDVNQSFGQPAAGPLPSDSALQRMARGQFNTDGGNESGLAQLSRIAQGYRSSQPEENNYNAPYQQQPEAAQQAAPRYAPQTYQQAEPTQFTARTNMPAPAQQNYPQAEPVQAMRGTTGTQTTKIAEISPSTSFSNYVPAPARPALPAENIGAQPLRASPIQDIPIERISKSQVTTEATRRPDVLSRTNYGPQTAQASAASAPLASITASIPVVVPNKVAPSVPGQEKTTVEEVKKEKAHPVEEEVEQWKEADSRVRIEQILEEAQTRQQMQHSPDLDESSNPDSAFLLDIVQSFPPVQMLSQPIQQQSVQPQVLSGRATRSLGNVLLNGHLVPQDRLEVAQNIQRMLRGVDLNYQLGDILLMFKLLTPDQLLAASLVSYGLISTTQITALGRIRQELHSIGLEYDLENLLILFRILTPEQLREVRSNFQS